MAASSAIVDEDQLLMDLDQEDDVDEETSMMMDAIMTTPATKITIPSSSATAGSITGGTPTTTSGGGKTTTTTPSSSTTANSSTSANSSSNNSDSKKQKHYFYKELRCMMYGFGDDKAPYTETVELLEEVVLEYIRNVVVKSIEVGKTGKLQLEDIWYLIRRDPKKYAKVKDLLTMNEELRKARKAFDEAKY